MDWNELASSFSGEKDPAKPDITMMPFDAAGLRKAWNDIGRLGQPVGIDAEKAWEKVEEVIDGNGEVGMGRFRIRFLLRVAAAIALLAVSAWLALTVVNPGNKTVVAGNLDKIVVNLPDGGTVVTLNRNSSLSYPSRFKGDAREVELTGEAFFDVARDEAQPFFVKTGMAEIKVLGTSFNVIAGDADHEVEVFVESGKVEVKNLNTDEVLTLEKGNIGLVAGERSTTLVNEDVNYISWSTGQLNYDGTELRKVFEDIKRVYGTDIRVTNDSIYGFPLSTDFNNQPVELVIRIICTTFNLNYTETDNEYTLSLK